ncbi:MAG: hypothetical protein IPO21_08600 [Bacteroidales bacterium]|nr:hypothetical protein [Bacteroidales bacterium]
MRVCYEVIKYLQPDDFVCLGGIGYSSFLDALLRNTDNPTDGSVGIDYPHKTGAYFDCVSYHAYPMYSLRKWNNSIKGFDHFRHSDEAVRAVVEKKAEFSKILQHYGYNDTLYPLKKYIITETNVPSIAIDEYIGSEWAQNNFLMKLIIAAQKADIKSVHTYCLYDGKPTSTVTSSYDAMGFYYNLDAVLPYNQVEKTAAGATRNTMRFLKNTTYDASQTAKLNLPTTVDGAAFKQTSGEYIYVLWAKTAIDKSEEPTLHIHFQGL